MFILHPDPYSLPCYRIGPFTTNDLGVNAALPKGNTIDPYFINRFGHSNFLYTDNGRRAINIALSHYKLQPNDVVTIFTTSDNFYISGCVTKEIEKFCKWSRSIEKESKLILVNHEFGYPYPDLKSLKKYNLPVIEDCANSFFSTGADNSIGTVGDFVVYSFPKIFPIQIGGLLKINIQGFNDKTYTIEPGLEQYIKNVLSKYISTEGDIKQKRIDNYQYLHEKFKQMGLEERFGLSEGIIPSVFMFKAAPAGMDLAALKNHFYNHGIQCSVFYGENAFFIPCHQNLKCTDLDYFSEVMKSFLKAAAAIA